MGQNQVVPNQKDIDLAREISQLLSPYLDEQVLSSVLEAKASGVKDIVIYLDTINCQIYEMEREGFLQDSGAPADLKEMLSNPSCEVASFGSEVPGYLSFWFVVMLPDTRVAAMAISSVPNRNTGIN
jgi:hypothetical protein